MVGKAKLYRNYKITEADNTFISNVITPVIGFGNQKGFKIIVLEPIYFARLTLEKIALLIEKAKSPKPILRGIKNGEF